MNVVDMYAGMGSVPAVLTGKDYFNIDPKKLNIAAIEWDADKRALYSALQSYTSGRLLY